MGAARVPQLSPPHVLVPERTQAEVREGCWRDGRTKTMTKVMINLRFLPACLTQCAGGSRTEAMRGARRWLPTGAQPPYGTALRTAELSPVPVGSTSGH